MLGFDDVYEPDEIFMDMDSRYGDWNDEELPELSFELNYEASEGMALLLSSAGEEVFAS